MLHLSCIFEPNCSHRLIASKNMLLSFFIIPIQYFSISFGLHGQALKPHKNIKMQFPDIIRALWWQLASVCKFNCWKMTLKNSIKNTRHIFTLNDSFFTWIMSLMSWKNRQQLLKQHLLLHARLLAVVVETNILLKYT